MEPYRNPDLENLIELTRPENAQFIINTLTRAGYDPKSMSVLDIGCGEGISTLAMSHFFKCTYGIDPSNKMLAAARENLEKLANSHIDSSTITFCTGSFDDISITNADFIIANNSIHMTDNIPTSIKNMISHGQVFCILEPSDTARYGSSVLQPDSPNYNKSKHMEKIKRVRDVRIAIKQFLNDASNNLEIIEKWYTKQKYCVFFRHRQIL